jgi:transposase-like protein
MTGKKISESIKNDIIHLYKHTGETTSTLAERYGVSNSTISRMLKITLPEQEYEVLIASKRAARVPGTDTVRQLTNSREIEPSLVVVQPQRELKLERLEEKTATPTPIIKRRSVGSQPEIPVAIDDSTRQNRPPLETESYAESSAKSDYAERSAKSDRNTESDIASPISKVIDSSSEQLATNNSSFPTEEETSAIVAEMFAEDMLEEAEDSEGLDDEDLDYSDDDDDLEEPTKIVKRASSSNALIQVLPLSEANLPKTCYLVIDRLSELITRPLKEFGDLGQIPAQETNQKTLPVFDNHRVARRFSTKRDRVIKVPDSKMLQKACPHLQAKGITRLLVDGQVYSLYPS